MFEKLFRSLLPSPEEVQDDGVRVTQQGPESSLPTFLLLAPGSSVSPTPVFFLSPLQSSLDFLILAQFLFPLDEFGTFPSSSMS